MASKLTGELSFATANKLLADADGLISAEILDLSSVTRCDSAGIALLLELQKRAQRTGRKLQFSGVSPQLKQLIHSYALNGILALA
jgi:phospholipid transport system transporter-binding protein